MTIDEGVFAEVMMINEEELVLLLLYCICSSGDPLDVTGPRGEVLLHCVVAEQVDSGALEPYVVCYAVCEL